MRVTKSGTRKKGECPRRPPTIDVEVMQLDGNRLNFGQRILAISKNPMLGAFNVQRQKIDSRFIREKVAKSHCRNGDALS
jgi:hypothetical protein